ncbi:hypothetical protein C8Q80DRAFT_1271069 [Daedaleopsis nitida]|nr:hypothetical protein C8Q80DRAFT_1271069 [Daedaleopsis nitida]
MNSMHTVLLLLAVNLSDFLSYLNVEEALIAIYTRLISREDVVVLRTQAIGRSKFSWKDLQGLFLPGKIRSLDLDVCDESKADWELDPTLELPNLPVLDDLRFSGLAVQLTPESVPRLRCLTACFSALHAPWPHLQAFMEILVRLPLLQSVSLDNYFFVVPPQALWTLPSFTFTTLTALELRYPPAFLHAILSIAEFPSLKSLHVVSTFCHDSDSLDQPYQTIFPLPWHLSFPPTRVEIVAKDHGFKLSATADNNRSMTLEICVPASLFRALPRLLRGAIADFGFLSFKDAVEIVLAIPAGVPRAQDWSELFSAQPNLAELRVSDVSRRAPTGANLVAALSASRDEARSESQEVCPSLRRLTLRGFQFPGGGMR